MTTKHPVPAKEGLTFKLKRHWNGDLARKSFTVGPKGEGCRNGEWVCATHGEVFRNNMEKDSHISDRKKPCTLVWHCTEHGSMEVP